MGTQMKTWRFTGLKEHEFLSVQSHGNPNPISPRICGTAMGHKVSLLKTWRRAKIVAKMRLAAIFLLKMALELTSLRSSSL
jgi:hypothetical protein